MEILNAARIHAPVENLWASISHIEVMCRLRLRHDANAAATGQLVCGEVRVKVGPLALALAREVTSKRSTVRAGLYVSVGMPATGTASVRLWPR